MLNKSKRIKLAFGIGIILSGAWWGYLSHRGPVLVKSLPTGLVGRWQMPGGAGYFFELDGEGWGSGLFRDGQQSFRNRGFWFSWFVQGRQFCVTPQSEDDVLNPACSDYRLSEGAVEILSDITAPWDFTIPRGIYRRQSASLPPPKRGHRSH